MRGGRKSERMREREIDRERDGDRSLVAATIFSVGNEIGLGWIGYYRGWVWEKCFASNMGVTDQRCLRWDGLCKREGGPWTGVCVWGGVASLSRWCVGWSCKLSLWVDRRRSSNYGWSSDWREGEGGARSQLSLESTNDVCEECVWEASRKCEKCKSFEGKIKTELVSQVRRLILQLTCKIIFVWPNFL